MYMYIVCTSMLKLKNSNCFIILQNNYVIVCQRWKNYSNSDSTLFPQILNIRIWIGHFLSPNIIRIFESFSSNLEYFKHRFPLNLNLNWELLGALATCWSHLWAPIDKTCAWMLLSHYTFMSFLDILSQFLLSAFYFPHYVQI